ncbi:uncharacterized protein LOC129886158 [Solanum dulcamara]|uniref:uncharacterized protein LOC129886158 n=1 Tax=Solanum dulcamara TaxID=45834 RepID=UPI002485FE66|nr:uncharacterized protein LOC129886158 [Solanum dulcamara]
MSQGNDNFTSHFEELSQVLDYFDSQTYPKILQESSILSSRRQLNEHYQSHYHNNQLPTDQFVMNRPDVDPTSRHVFVDAITNGLNYMKYNANFNWTLVPAAASSATNNSRIDYAHSRVPRMHQSSSHSGREVVEQEHRQSRRDYPQVIRPTPYKAYDPRYAAICLPVDPNLPAFKRNPHYSTLKATSDESATTKTIRTDYARNRVPRLHQSCSHSGREVFEQEHRQSRREYPRVIRPIPYKAYDPRYAAIGPNLPAFKRNPHYSMLKATSDESATTKNIRTDHARNRVPRLHHSSSHSGREVFEQEHTQSRIDYPRVIRPAPYKLYDPRYAAIGLPVDPFLRAFKLNPNFGLAKRDE